MPVRSLNSSVLKWPDGETVDRAVRLWSVRQEGRRPELRRLGYFGSYARGDWGVGSDLDLVAVVEHSPVSFERRNPGWDLNSLPVHAEILVYTADEWRKMQKKGGRFVRMLNAETVWVYPPDSRSLEPL